MFESLKRKLFGTANERKFIAALDSGKVIISGYDFDWNHDYDFGSYMTNDSYITLINASDNPNVYATNHAKIYPTGRMKIFRGSDDITSPAGEYDKLFKKAYKIINDKKNAEAKVAADKEAERFLNAMRDVFGEL